MKDASGHEHDEKGLFTGPGGSGVTPASELKKKSTGELTKINPWDDEKTKKMKMKLAKMHAGNQGIKDDIAKRKAHIEQMKKEMGRNEMKEIAFGEAVALNWTAPEDGGSSVKVQLSPIGEFELRDGGRRSGTVQHCSKAAFAALVENWRAAGSPDVLVDVDHASAHGGSTEAAAWCNALEATDEGLFGVFNLTPRGRELVENRAYRFVSPGWTLSDDGTPLALCSVALTNRPNLPVKPVVNSGDAGGRDPDDPTSTKGQPEMDLKKIAAALGLPETATEEEVLAAVKAMKARDAQAAEEAANAKAEKFAEDAVKAGKIAANAKEAVKAAWRKSPEVAQEMLNSLATSAAPAAKLPDFNAGKTPQALNAVTPGKDATPAEVYNHYMAMPEGSEKDAYLAANAQAISDGYEAVNKK